MGTFLTYSGIKTFKTCRKKYWFNEIEGLAVDSKKFVLGKLVHECLENLYNKAIKPTEVKNWICDKDLDTDEETYYEICDLAVFMVNEYCKVQLEQDFERFEIMGTEIPIQLTLEKMVKRGFVEPYDENIKAGELIKDLPIDVYYGMLDGLFKDKETGEYYVHEIKTMASISGNISSALMLEDQPGFYCWAASKVLGVKVRNVVYSILRKSLPHPPKQLKSGKLSEAKDQNTTYDLYLKAIEDNKLKIDDYTDILDELKNNPKEFIYREEFHKTDQEIAEVEEQIFSLLDEIKNCNSYYRNAVEAWRGGCFCDYKSICMDDTEEGRDVFSEKDHPYPDSGYNKIKGI